MAAALDMDRVKAALVIGVTGHRDIRDEDREPLKASVRRVLTDLRQHYPSTPFILLSPLADGADRLVAEVALLPEIAARLVAPLPMPKEMYETDFDPDSLKEFGELLRRADHWFELPLVADAAAVSREGPERDLQYEAVGRYIAGESQILLALWDGDTPGKVGGTAAIVKFQTEGISGGQGCGLIPPELFPVYHILTPRVSNPSPQGVPFQLRIIYPPVFGSGGKAKRYYDKAFGNLEEFNRVVHKGAELETDIKQSKTWVIGGFDEQNFSPGETWMLNRYTIADVLAIQFQKRMLYAHRALHWLVFLSFSSFVLYAHVHGHPPLALFLALVLLGVGLVIHKIAKQKALDEKRLDYRALAEGCRVSFFWVLAGIRDSVPDKYLGKQRSELDWIRNGMRGWRIDLDKHPPTTWNQPKDRLQFVLKQWVADQHKFFERAVEKSEAKAEFMERLVAVCLSLAIGIGVGLFIFADLVPMLRGDEPIESSWIEVAIIAIDISLAGAALLHHANERMAHSEHTKQYGRMLQIFDNAAKSIRGLVDSNDLSGAKSCIQALGEEALEENGDWVLLHRQRPLEIPHP